MMRSANGCSAPTRCGRCWSSAARPRSCCSRRCYGARAGRCSPRRSPWLQFARVMLSVAESIMFFIAVTYLPLADTVTFYLAAPIYVTALSAVFLKEHVGWRRWSAVVVGFIGVMIALRPSAATLTMPALIAIVGSFCFAVFLVITRMLRGTSDVVMVSGTFGAMVVVSGAVAPLSWIAPSTRDLGLMMLLGVVAMAAFA